MSVFGEEGDASGSPAEIGQAAGNFFPFDCHTDFEIIAVSKVVLPPAYQGVVERGKEKIHFSAQKDGG